VCAAIVARLTMLFAMNNLWMARKQLMGVAWSAAGLGWPVVE
jgi:hypothetical protein